MHEEERQDELAHGGAEVAETAVHAEAVALLAREERRDVGHRRGESAAADAREERRDRQLQVGDVAFRERDRRPRAGSRGGST